MKKSLLLVIILVINIFPAFAQFVKENPGVTISEVNDIEAADNGNIIVAADAGVLVYSNGAWKHFDVKFGTQSSRAVDIEPYPGGFMYSTEYTHVGACDYSGIVYDKNVQNSAYPFHSVTAIGITPPDTLFGTDIGQVFLKNASYSGDTPLTMPVQLGTITSIKKLKASPAYHVITSSNQNIIYDIPSGTMVPISAPLLPSNNVLSHAVEGSTTYDGTDKGLYIYDLSGASGSNQQINKSNSPLPSDEIKAVAVWNGNLFLGTPGGLAVRMNGVWKIFTSAGSNLPESHITGLAIDKTNNRLWIGTLNGHICRIGINEIATSVENAAGKPGAVPVYPNPSQGIVYVNIGEDEDVALRVYNMQGQVVFAKNIQRERRVDISLLPAGQYIAELATAGGITGRTLITIVN